MIPFHCHFLSLVALWKQKMLGKVEIQEKKAWFIANDQRWMRVSLSKRRVYRIAISLVTRSLMPNGFLHKIQVEEETLFAFCEKWNGRAHESGDGWQALV